MLCPVGCVPPRAVWSTLSLALLICMMGTTLDSSFVEKMGAQHLAQCAHQVPEVIGLPLPLPPLPPWLGAAPAVEASPSPWAGSAEPLEGGLGHTLASPLFRGMEAQETWQSLASPLQLGSPSPPSQLPGYPQPPQAQPWTAASILASCTGALQDSCSALAVGEVSAASPHDFSVCLSR